MSFMDRKNILSEGFFDMLRKFLNKPKLLPQDKKLMKDPEFKKLYNDAMKDFKQAGASWEKMRKKQKSKKSKYYKFDF